MAKLPALTTPKKEYKKIYSYHIEGEKASLRSLNPKHPHDFIRYKQIYNHPLVEEFMDGICKKTTNKDLRKFMVTNSDSIMFAVAKHEDKNKRLQGWIEFVPDSVNRMKRIPKGINYNKNARNLYLEVSFARFLSRCERQATKGLISSGIRQACKHLTDMEEIYAERNRTEPRNITVNAYVSKKNKPSIRALERSGFIRKSRVPYHNPDFKKYLEEPEDYYYKLNWKKLEKLIKTHQN